MVRMTRLLGEEFRQFEQSNSKPPTVVLDVNTLKLSVANFSTISPFALKAAGAHEPDGYLVTDQF